jgi:hypothetical protein
MNLGTHMPDGERRKPVDIDVCRTNVKVKLLKIEKKLILCFRFRTISKERNIGSN